MRIGSRHAAGLTAKELAGAALQKFREFFERKAALFEDIPQRTLRNFGVHGNNSLPTLSPILFSSET
jgi:hypothetical protein